jgi:peptidyl-prolyl cis-trans isomerase B (cyclophilin B)
MRFARFNSSRLLRSGSKAASSRSKVQGCCAAVQKRLRRVQKAMEMKRTILVIMVWIVGLGAFAQTDADTLVRPEVLLETSMGNIRLVLYNETPQHRDNFLKLVNEGFYDGNLWHRVIFNFMIQTGDSTTRHAKPGESVGLHSPDYTIPAEIVYPKYFHKRGALAAAREGDAENPERASSASQFYIVYGTTYSSLSLDKFQERIDQATDGKYKMTEEIRDHYRKYGGTPHLDGQYTVFGEVVEGMDVVRKIQMVQTDDYARPIDDVKIIKATVVKRNE